MASLPFSIALAGKTNINGAGLAFVPLIRIPIELYALPFGRLLEGCSSHRRPVKLDLLRVASLQNEANASVSHQPAYVPVSHHLSASVALILTRTA